MLRVRVAARPIDGAANAALVRLLARELDVAPGRISLRSGATGRTKVLEVQGLAAGVARSRWPGLDV